MSKEDLMDQLKEIEYKLGFAINKQHTLDIIELCIKRNELKNILKNS